MKSIKDKRSISVKGSLLASLIYKYFSRYSKTFYRLTNNAKNRFEDRDWKNVRSDSIKRLNLYENFLEEIESKIISSFGKGVFDSKLWISAKLSFKQRITGSYYFDIAETFFNSVTRRILRTEGINRNVEFFHLYPRKIKKIKSNNIYRSYRLNSTTKDVMTKILSDYRFKQSFENLERDALFIAHETDLYLWPVIKYDVDKVIEMIKVPFYRNKVAYLVGRIIVKGSIIPFVLPLYNGVNGIFVDAVLFRKRQLNIIFGFAHTCFHIPIDRYRELMSFLLTILPENRIDELYFMIGFRKHGKTVFYRDLHHYIHESKEKFKIAEGMEGSTMIVFTLPNFNFVFKIIKDRTCYLRSDIVPNKNVSREHIVNSYNFVINQDKVGRLVDTHEFENLRFKIKRFSSELIREFKLAARECVDIDEKYIMIKHLYIQRKVIPLPLFLESEKDPEVIREILIDYGYFLKDLVSVGIFPTDLFNLWNCGVTTRRRIVLFDYDDVESLLKIHFKIKPEPKNIQEELMRDEDRIAATRNDFFMDEIEMFLGIPKSLQGTFNQVHGDLYNIHFWKNLQYKVRKGEIADIIPYDKARRFMHRFDFSHYDMNSR